MYVSINTVNGKLFIYHIFLVVYSHYAITYVYTDCNINQNNNTFISNVHKLRAYPHLGFPKVIFPSGTVWCLWSLSVLRESELQCRKPSTCKTPCQGQERDGQIRFRYRCPVIYISWYIISYWISISLKYINCYKTKSPSIILTCRAPAKNGPTAAPIDPVPSIMEVTVARAFPEPRKLGCVPSSAETAVVISA